MKRLLTLCMILCTCVFLQGQTIEFENSNLVEYSAGDDPWTGELCGYIGDPSSGLIDFNIVGFDAISVTVSSSNILVVPIASQNLNLLLNSSGGIISGGRLSITPMRSGESSIIIRAMNEDWETINFYLSYTAKSCRDIQTVRQRNVDPLNLTNKQVFHADDRTQSGGTLVLASGSDIEFLAGNCVLLRPGFEIRSNAEFLADIEPCDN